MSVDYRLASENRLPAAFYDRLATTRWLRQHASCRSTASDELSWWRDDVEDAHEGTVTQARPSASSPVKPSPSPSPGARRQQLQHHTTGPLTSTAAQLPPAIATAALLLSRHRPCQGPCAMSLSSSSSSSSAGSTLGGSHAGLALAATAMALSGTLVLFSLCRAKPQHHLVASSSSGESTAAATPTPSPARLWPCLSSSEKQKREKAWRGSKKRVRFADDIVNNGAAHAALEEEESQAPEPPSCRGAACTLRTMPANREALYCGMLRSCSMLRVACSY